MLISKANCNKHFIANNNWIQSFLADLKAMLTFLGDVLFEELPFKCSLVIWREQIVLFQYIAFLFSKTEVQHFKTPARLLVPGIRIRDPSKKNWQNRLKTRQNWWRKLNFTKIVKATAIKLRNFSLKTGGVKVPWIMSCHTKLFPEKV